MISQPMQTALNEQIRNEMHSAYVYLSMAAYFESVPFEGFSAWMRVQAQEEVVHAMKIFDHLLDRGGAVKLQAMPEPPHSIVEQLRMVGKDLPGLLLLDQRYGQRSPEAE